FYRTGLKCQRSIFQKSLEKPNQISALRTSYCLAVCDVPDSGCVLYPRTDSSATPLSKKDDIRMTPMQKRPADRGLQGASNFQLK
ncbi:hypothetical protein, partial [Larsenimonas salina]|uniref:hypothetical protein n=1 Tax=Larsenimonas salina TaxID=1295565 RepID=UPI0020741710